MNATIVVAASPTHWPLLAITAPRLLAYALRWGMGLQIHRLEKAHEFDITKTWDFRPGWEERNQILLNAMTTSSAEWFLFVGSDVLITNPDLSPGSFTEGNAHDLIIGADDRSINNDVFWMRNVPASHRFLAAVIARREVDVNDHPAMLHVLAEKWYAADLIDLSRLQGRSAAAGTEGRPLWKPGMFTLHANAMPMADRLRVLGEVASQVSFDGHFGAGALCGKV